MKMNSMNTEGQLRLCLLMLNRACDMRITHAKRARLLKYAREVLALNNAEMKAYESQLTAMIAELEGYVPIRFTHAEIKAIIREVRDHVKETVDSQYPAKRQGVALDDIPF